MSIQKVYRWLKRKAGWGYRNLRHTPMTSCLNCGEALQSEDYFCSSCGQKIHTSRLTVWTLLSEFFAGMFNLENGFYRSIQSMFIPAFLTKEFMEGRRKNYINPIRFFLITLLIHLATLDYIIDLEDLTQLTTANIETIGSSKVYDQYIEQRDTLLQIGISEALLDSIEKIVFVDIPRSDQDTINLDFILVFKDFSGFTFTTTDVYNMPIGQLMEKYEVKKSFDRLVISQFIRTMRDVPGAIRFGLGNITWGVITTMLLLGLIMKLLYIRRKYYYVEHFILLCHIHAFAFIMGSAALLFNHFWGTSFNRYLLMGTYFIIFIYFFFSIKRYYRQGWIKSILKYFLITSSYIMLLTMMVSLIVFISLFFF